MNEIKTDLDEKSAIAVLAMVDQEFLKKAFAHPEKIMDKMDKASTYEISPLVGSNEVLPAKTVLFVRALKDDFRTVHLKKSGYNRLVFDARLLVGQLEPLQRKSGEPVTLKAGDAMTIMLGDPENPSPSLLYKGLAALKPFKDKELALVNLGKEKYKGREYWNIKVVPAEKVKELLEG